MDMTFDAIMARVAVPAWHPNVGDEVDAVCDAVERALHYAATLPAGDARRIALEASAQRALDDLCNG